MVKRALKVVLFIGLAVLFVSCGNKKNLTEEEKKRIIIAYEPIWSIGTGVIPTNEQIEETISFIKKDFPHNSVLYGGSANEENIDQLSAIWGRRGEGV